MMRKTEMLSWEWCKSLPILQISKKCCKCFSCSFFFSFSFLTMNDPAANLNEALMTKIGFDSAENESSQVWANNQRPTLPRRPKSTQLGGLPGSPPANCCVSFCAVLMTPSRFCSQETRRASPADRQNFGKMMLVFGCIGTDFCK